MSLEFIPAARPLIGAEERAAVDAVLAGGIVVQGPQVAAFEKEFSARVVGGAHCVAVNSGTSAQHLAALAAGRVLETERARIRIPAKELRALHPSARVEAAERLLEARGVGAQAC